MEYRDFLLTMFPLDFVDKLLKSLETKPYAGVRLNTLKDIEYNPLESLEKHPYVDNGYIFDKEEIALGKAIYHDQGLYYIQEPSAMLVGSLLNVKKDDLVIDLCAAPGGKSTHVASFLGEDGLLISNDINTQRSKELSGNIARMGIKNCLVTNDNVAHLESHFGGIFDKVILDAPCSGEGMFRKNKEAEKDWSEDKVKRLSELQKELILQAYHLLKRGGLLIYSTCTFNKYENEEVINYLLENTNATLVALPKIPNANRGIDMDEAIRLFPTSFKGEGHFIALICCNDDNPLYYRSKKEKTSDRKSYNVFANFVKENLNIEFDSNRIINNNNHFYYLPKNNLNLDGIKVLRFGLYLGEIRSTNFFPSHDFALSSKPNEWKRHLELNENEANAYLKGLSIERNADNGYTLLTYKNYPLGLGKIVNGIIKNHYPKNLRHF